MSERWIQRFEQAGWLERAGLLGGGAVRLAARAIDHSLDRAAQITVEAQDAFKKELDPNISDATILEETDERQES
ncbi:MAG: hypothetical protein Rubg2KO_07060 [Rubricoccaceae bacterium]